MAAHAGEGARLPQHAALLASGEQALARGDAAAAIDAFERAASAHDEAAELGLVRARLQAGDYRAALALAAHVAGEHREAEPAALYAALLQAGGHAEHAQRVLGGSPPAAAPALPVAWGAMAPAGARVVGNAVLVAAGRAVMPTPRTALPRLWLRNGLGQTVTAVPVSGADGLTTLALDTPLPWDRRLEPAARPPFAGSPAFVVAYRPSETAAADWPQLHAGFLGSGLQAGVAAPAWATGAPLLDAAGRLAGIVLQGPDGLLHRQPLPAGAAAASGAPARVSAEEAYERGLRIALQVIAATD